MAKFVRKKNVNDQLISVKSDYDSLIRFAFRIVSQQLTHEEKVKHILSEYKKVAPDVERNDHFLERITKLKLEIQNKPKKKLTQYFKDVAALFREGEIISEADYEELIFFEKKEEKVVQINSSTVQDIPQPKLIKVDSFPFYYKETTKKNEETKEEEEEIDKEKQKDEELNYQEISRKLAELVSQEIETEETIKVKTEVLSIVSQMIRKVDWSPLDPDLDVTYTIYGSYINQLSTKSSDIDISLNVNIDNIEDKIILKHFKQAIANDLKKHATKVPLLIEGRVTLLEIEFIKFGVAISFSVNNKLGDINSRMIELYTKLDERCQMLGLLVKIWANKHGIISAKRHYPSSYAYNLMVINFLQTVKPPVLPSLQQLRANDPNPTILLVKKYGSEGKYETRVDYEDDQEKLKKIMTEKYSKNTMSTVELLRRFFRFYRNRKSVEKINLSVKQGKHTNRSLYEENSKYLYSIEDPFDLDHNPGKFVLKTSDHAGRLISTMEESYSLLKRKKVLDIFEPDL